MRAWQKMFTDFLAARGVDRAVRRERLLRLHRRQAPLRRGPVVPRPRATSSLPEGDPGRPARRRDRLRPGQPEERRLRRGAGDEGVEPYPGRSACWTSWPSTGTKVAVVSSSRNAPAVLAAAGLADRFEVVVDGTVAAAERAARQAGARHLPVRGRAARRAGRAGGRRRGRAVRRRRPGAPADFGLVIGVDRGVGADRLTAGRGRRGGRRPGRAGDGHE